MAGMNPFRGAGWSADISPPGVMAGSRLCASQTPKDRAVGSCAVPSFCGTLRCELCYCFEML